MKNRKIFYINLIYYISLLLVAGVFVLGFLGVFKSDILTSIILQIVIITAIPILMYSLLVSKSFKQTLSDFGFKKLSKKLILISIAIAITLYFFNMFVANAFGSIIILLGYDTTIPTLQVSNGEMIKEFILTACLPGLCEEILHRGMLLNGYKKQGLTRYGLIISSILFGLMHLNIMQFFYAAILGVFMGISVIATESIWTSVIIHFTNNFLSVYFSLDKNLPLHDLYNYIINKIASLNPFIFIIVTTLCILALVKLFTYLINLIMKIKSKEQAERLYKELKLDDMTEDEAKAKIDEINTTLSLMKKGKVNSFIKNDSTLAFTDKIFYYSSILLGTLATAFSFIVAIL